MIYALVIWSILIAFLGWILTATRLEYKPFYAEEIRIIWRGFIITVALIAIPWGAWWWLPQL